MFTSTIEQYVCSFAHYGGLDFICCGANFGNLSVIEFEPSVGNGVFAEGCVVAASETPIVVADCVQVVDYLWNIICSASFQVHGRVSSSSIRRLSTLGQTRSQVQTFNWKINVHSELTTAEHGVPCV